ncbi:unnamed protein product [Peniophora sp. CBMAI 1063]|nr:unnamed protein product [Peniophora sp. CBMAI 1063]
MNDATVTSFTSLPQELAVLILGMLCLRDLLAATEVSRHFLYVVRSTPMLQYRIELVACGMRDNPRSETTTANKLENLRRHDQAWRLLRWSDDVRFRIPRDGHVESKQGVILITKERARPDHGAEVQLLPSDTRNIPRRSWTIEPGHNEELNGDDREIYEVDASQDLLLIRHGTTPANTFLAVYTISDGLPHPQAALSSFRISNNGPLRGSTAGAFVRREWVYLLDQSFQIYNWKTGERNGDHDWRGTLSQCAFVGDRYIAAVVVGIPPSPAVLRIYELPSADPAVPPTYPPTVAVLAFFLPAIANALTTDTEWKLVGGSAQSASLNDALGGGDFTTDRDETLVLIPFRVRDRDFELIIATERLLEFLPHPGDIASGAGSYSLRDVPWDEWGPECTHLRSVAANDDAVHEMQASIFGSRHVLPHPVQESGGQSAVRVDDYQPARVRRAENNQSPSHRVHHGEDTQGEWFEANELHTDLPFVETNMRLPEAWQNKNPHDVHVSINEDGVTLIDKSEEGEYGEAYTL